MAISESTAIQTLIKQKNFFSSGATRSSLFRIDLLIKLRKIIKHNKLKIENALKIDLGKPDMEIVTNEIGYVIQDIKHMCSRIKKWNKAKKVKTPFMLKPGKSYSTREPYGNVLVIGPWNYPFQLSLIPCIGAIAGGNTVILKPSEYAPETASVLKEIINTNFPSEIIEVRNGDAEIASELSKMEFDYLFFTGSSNVGKIIRKNTANRLLPMTLELGGKNPCVIDSTIDLNKAVKRIVWGKYLNCGQTCIAPDYILIPGNRKKEFIKLFESTVNKFYGNDASESDDYGRIINKMHFERLVSLLSDGEIKAGGKYNINKKYISPTLLDNIKPDSKLNTDEIFGPILPIYEYNSNEELLKAVEKCGTPLAFYMFSKNKDLVDSIQHKIKTGAYVVNDTVSQIMNPFLPFGGVGDSGMGSYHGKETYNTFTRPFSIYKKHPSFELSLKYPPFNKRVIGYVEKAMY